MKTLIAIALLLFAVPAFASTYWFQIETFPLEGGSAVTTVGNFTDSGSCASYESALIGVLNQQQPGNARAIGTGCQTSGNFWMGLFDAASVGPEFIKLGDFDTNQDCMTYAGVAIPYYDTQYEAHYSEGQTCQQD